MSPRGSAVNGREIRLIRTQHALTQSGLAGRLGVSQPTVSLWERGRSIPSASQMRELEHLRSMTVSGDEVVSVGEETSFGQWVRQQRLNLGFTVEQLAQKAGVSVPQVYNIETGRTLSFDRML